MMVAYPISGRPVFSVTSAAAPADARGPARDRGAGRAAATASTPSGARGVTPTPTFPHGCQAASLKLVLAGLSLLILVENGHTAASGQAYDAL
jgi:hypothetical protein